MSQSSKSRVLVVDDEADIRFFLQAKLAQAGIVADLAATVSEAMVQLKNIPYDLILLDLFLDNEISLDHLHDVFSLVPSVKVVILTGHGSIDFAVKALNKGATDFLIKSAPIDENIQKIAGILAARKTPNPGGHGSLARQGIIGQSKVLVQLEQKIKKLQHADSTVLLQGESGTGKELFARAIHDLSGRSAGPYIALNCAAIAENILESELFGYKRGAFTDAKSDRKGYFETCSGGTLFLDEVGELSLNLQAKLLRVLQEREVTPLGSCKPISVDTRIIAATNRDLMGEVQNKTFRNDLFYRLAIFMLDIPPLRQRREDIPALVDFFIAKFNKRFNKLITPPSQTVLSRLGAYDWPGNVRELQNAIERGVVLADGDQLQMDEILPHHVPDTLPTAENLSWEQLPLNFMEAKEAFERAYIRNLLQTTGGNVSEAARLSGQYRPNLYRLVHKYEIDIQGFKLPHSYMH